MKLRMTKDGWVELAVLIAAITAGSALLQLVARLVLGGPVDQWCAWMIAGLLLYPAWSRVQRLIRRTSRPASDPSSD